MSISARWSMTEYLSRGSWISPYLPDAPDHQEHDQQRRPDAVFDQKTCPDCRKQRDQWTEPRLLHSLDNLPRFSQGFLSQSRIFE
jgi:hypothetical protein